MSTFSYLFVIVNPSLELPDTSDSYVFGTFSTIEYTISWPFLYFGSPTNSFCHSLFSVFGTTFSVDIVNVLFVTVPFSFKVTVIEAGLAL